MLFEQVEIKKAARAIIAKALKATGDEVSEDAILDKMSDYMATWIQKTQLEAMKKSAEIHLNVLKTQGSEELERQLTKVISGVERTFEGD